MTVVKHGKLSLGAVILGAAFLAASVTGSADDTSDAIADALSAAWPGMAANATVVDWEGNVLRGQGSDVHGQRVDGMGGRLVE
jgi:hypothetical protein